MQIFKNCFQMWFFTFCHQILSILSIGANIGSCSRTTLQLFPSPTAFSILHHFLGDSLLWIHLSPLAILYKMLLKSIPSINVMSYLHVISFWNTKRSRKMCFRYQVPKHFTLNDVIMVTGVIGIRITRMNGIRDILAKN